MFQCYNCRSEAKVAGVICRSCGLSWQGDFETPRLARLPAAEQQLVEAMILSGGNLSRMAEVLKVSYPTLRKRVDALIERLAALRQADSERIEELLAAVERGELAAEAAARRIGEMGGET